jgi:hypothetical protein
VTAPRIRPAVLIGAAALALALAACTGTPAAPVTTLSAAPTPTETVPPAPALVPDGTAEDNLPYFTQIVQQVWASPDQVAGRAYVDALVGAGFDKAAMQVTQDQTTVGNPAETIQFSVLWGDQCLLGQVGPATGQPVTAVQPAVLGGTACLLGSTRPIDW